MIHPGFGILQKDRRERKKRKNATAGREIAGTRAHALIPKRAKRTEDLSRQLLRIFDLKPVLGKGSRLLFVI